MSPRKRTAQELARIKEIKDSSPFPSNSNLHLEFVTVRIQRMDCEIAAQEAIARIVPILGTIGESKMNAGPDLDALIAEKIFGWSEIQSVKAIHGNQYQGYDPNDVPSQFTGYRPKRVVPQYSTDIAAAWKVVEKLNLFEEYSLSKSIVGQFPGENGKWKIETYELDSMGSLGEMSHFTFAEAETAPLAICLAALKAI